MHQQNHPTILLCMGEKQTTTKTTLLKQCTREEKHHQVQGRKMTIFIATKKAPKQIKEPISKTETKVIHRRSPRMPSATAKYWESIKAKLRNPNQDE